MISDQVLYIAAFILFVLAAFNTPVRFGLVAAGLACLAATLLT